MRRVLLLSTLLLALTAPLTLTAQTVRGRLAGREGGRVAGARVVLLDTEARVVAAATTGPDGRYTLTAREAGLYRLRVERVGFQATYSPPFSLEAGQTVQRELVAGDERVQLQGIAVEAGSRCEVRPQEGRQTATLWEEARKALELTRAAAQQRQYRFDARSYERVLDSQHMRVTRESTRTLQNFRGTPYAAADLERLTERGWVDIGRDTMVFYAPDARVLLSDLFLDQHCFRVREAPDPGSGLVGLAFEPVRGRRVPDVQGVLWLDRATAELRTLEYGYTGIDNEIREWRLAGGTVEFLRLPAGSWIVSRWNIRMPVVESSPSAGWRSTSEARRLAAVAVREEGGEVTSIRDGYGRVVSMQEGATLAGVVTDSTTGRPLAGAVVFLASTPHEATAGEDGRFVLSGLPAGRYAVSFRSPRLDSLRWAPTPAPVDLERGEVTRRDLAVPPMPAVLTALCADSAAADGPGRLAGFVRFDSTAAPVPGARVALAWTGPDGQRRQREAVADYRGIYRFCSLPAGASVTLEATAPGSSATLSGVALAAGGAPAQQDLELPAARVAAAAPRPGTGGAGQTAVRVRVLNAETQRPVAGALVRLGPSLPERRTGSDGTVLVEDVPLGPYDVRVAHPDHGERTVHVSVSGGTELELRVPPRRLETVALAPVVATTRPLSRELAAALEEKRESGARRVVVSREQIQRMSSATPNLQNVLRAFVPGITVTEQFYPGTTIVRSIRVLYRGQPVAVYLDSRRLSNEEVTTLSPRLVQAMVFYPNTLGNQRFQASSAASGGAVLLLFSAIEVPDDLP